MTINDALLSDLPDGDILEVRIGLNWTVVVTELDGKVQCGLASTLKGNHNHTGTQPETAPHQCEGSCQS